MPNQTKKVLGLLVCTWVTLVLAQVPYESWLLIFPLTSGIAFLAIYYFWRKDWNQRLEGQSARFGTPELSSDSDWPDAEKLELETDRHLSWVDFVASAFAVMSIAGGVTMMNLAGLFGVLCGAAILAYQMGLFGKHQDNIRQALNSSLSDYVKGEPAPKEPSADQASEE